MTSSYRCAVALSIAALLGPANALATDTVILRNGKSFTGTVVRDDARGVALRSAGSPEFARADVREVVYDDGRPAEYSLAREAEEEGRHEDAARLLREALDGPHHELLEQYILLDLARAEERAGDASDARAACGRLAEKGPATRFLFEALEGLVRLGADVRLPGPAPGAGPTSGADAPGPDAGLTETQLALLRAGVHEMQGRHEKALETFGRAAALAAAGSDLARRAGLGEARCLVRLGRGGEAAKRLRDLLRREEGAASSAEAYVLLGDALASVARTPDEWREAALAYLRVPVHHPGDPATEVPALKGAARCYRQIAEGGPALAAKLEDFLARSYPRAAAGGG